MAHRVIDLLEQVAEFLTRLWPMSREEDAVVEELSAVYQQGDDSET